MTWPAGGASIERPNRSAAGTWLPCWSRRLWCWSLVTRLVCNDEHGNSSFWPANGALVVAILLLPPGLSLLTCLACFAANLALNLIPLVGLYENVLYSALNIGMSYLAAFLTRSLCGAVTDLSRAGGCWSSRPLPLSPRARRPRWESPWILCPLREASRYRIGSSGRSAMRSACRWAHRPSFRHQKRPGAPAW